MLDLQQLLLNSRSLISPKSAMLPLGVSLTGVEACEPSSCFQDHGLRKRSGMIAEVKVGSLRALSVLVDWHHSFCVRKSGT